MSESADPPAPLPAIPVAPVLPVSLSDFSYIAQTEHGIRLTGTIEAPDHATALLALEGMRLRVAKISAIAGREPKPARGDVGFLHFNQRLAQLAKTGMPIEDGLRLIAADMRRGRLSGAIAKIASDVQAGVPLAAAFDKHRKFFPSLYGRLIDVGVSGGNLPGVLLNLGRHLELQQRLSGSLWRSVSHPLATFCGLLLVVGGIGLFVMPRFVEMFAGYHLQVPAMMEAVIRFGLLAPYLAAGMAGFLALFALARAILRVFGAETIATERLLLPMPLIGPVLRFNLIARWLDTVRIGVVAGQNLPAAVALAGECTRSPALRRDGADLIAALAARTPLAEVQGRILPATAPMTIEFASRDHDLPAALGALCDLYERQAELRLERIPAILTPVLVILIAAAIGFVISGIVLPLISVINALTRSIY